MKLIFLSLVSLLLSVSHLAASPHPPPAAKITKNEAEHIALRNYPGARVTAAKLETVQGTLSWSIEIARSNAKVVAVAVDARTGRVLSRKKGTR